MFDTFKSYFKKSTFPSKYT